MAQSNTTPHQNGENQPLLSKQGPQTYEQKHHRNQSFAYSKEPFQNRRDLRLDEDEVDGVFSCFNPTQASFSYLGDAETVHDDGESEDYSQNADQSHETGESDIEYKWTSRNNRKGRHALVVHESSSYDSPETGANSVLSGIWRMFTVFNFWDISYVTAIVFTLAVAILLLNAVLSAIPYINPNWRLPPEMSYVEAALTFAGCFFFLISSFLSWLEALNADQQGCFGCKCVFLCRTNGLGDAR